MRAFRLPVVAAFLLAAGCGSIADGSGSPTIPDGSTIFKLEPALLQYHYVDTSGINNVTLTWLPSQGFVGYNCLAFKPNTPTDTTGTFVFAWNGQNTGRVQRESPGILDTLQAFFFPPTASPLGTHGTYVTDSSGKVKLTWADGVRSRYFQDAADIRFSGDSVISKVDVKAVGDSIHEQWTVYWIYDFSCNI